MAGIPTRLVELPPITPSDDDLIQLAFKAAMASPQFRRLTPVMLGGMLALVSPYASDRQRQGVCCGTWLSTPKMRSRLGPVVVEIELVKPLTPRYVLQLEGPFTDALCMYAVEPGDGSHLLLISSSESASLVSASPSTRTYTKTTSFSVAPNCFDPARRHA